MPGLIFLNDFKYLNSDVMNMFLLMHKIWLILISFNDKSSINHSEVFNYA